jgi:hypothetical protein
VRVRTGPPPPACVTVRTLAAGPPPCVSERLPQGAYWVEINLGRNKFTFFLTNNHPFFDHNFSPMLGKFSRSSLSALRSASPILSRVSGQNLFDRLITRKSEIAHRNVHDFSSEISAGEANMNAPVYVVWGAGTDVGKTLISAGICYASSQISVAIFCFHSSNILRRSRTWIDGSLSSNLSLTHFIF